jgi:Uma2 family endonuclease
MASALVHGIAAKLTAGEYGNLSDVPGFKDELIEGERVLSPVPKFPHTYVIDALESLLRQQYPEMRIVREAGWRFRSEDGVDSVPGPDLMLVHPEDYDRAVRSGDYFEGQPVLVIEVVSPNERRSRRMQKVGLYLEAGAHAVVEVDYTKRCVFVYRPGEDVPSVNRERIESPFAADLSEIFQPLG